MVLYRDSLPASNSSHASYDRDDSDDASSIVSHASSGILQGVVDNFKTALILSNERGPPLCHAKAPAAPEETIEYDDDGQILYASKEALIKRLASDFDRRFVDDFLLTYRFFMLSRDLAWSLADCLERSFREEDQSTKLRVFVIIRDWLQNYWEVDIEADQVIQETFSSMLRRLNTLAPRLTLADHQILNKLHKLLEAAEFKDKSLSCPSLSHASLASSGQGKLDSWRAKFRNRLLDFMNRRFQDPKDKGDPTPLSLLESESPTSIAEQLCMVEARRLKAVCWIDLLPPKRGAKSPNSVVHFNASCIWFTTEVTRHPSNVGRQARLLTRLIRTAAACLHLNNYNSLVQITLALQSSALSELHEAWGRLARRDTRLYHDLLAYCSPLWGFHHLRRAMWSLGAAAPAELCATPCIPFAGLFMSDLASAKEQLDAIIETKKLSGRTDGLRIPWGKCKTMAHTIRLYRVLQARARHYSFEVRPELLSQLEVSHE